MFLLSASEEAMIQVTHIDLLFFVFDQSTGLALSPSCFDKSYPLLDHTSCNSDRITLTVVTRTQRQSKLGMLQSVFEQPVPS